MKKQQVFEFTGDQVTVNWTRRLCIHVDECVRAKEALPTLSPARAAIFCISWAMCR